MIHHKNNNLTKALEDITLAINLNDEVDYIKQRIMYLMENEQCDKAIEDVNYLLRFGGQSPKQTAEFCNDRGDAYLQLGQKTKACLDWKKSTNLQRDENIVVKIKQWN